MTWQTIGVISSVAIAAGGATDLLMTSRQREHMHSRLVSLWVTLDDASIPDLPRAISGRVLAWWNHAATHRAVRLRIFLFSVAGSWLLTSCAYALGGTLDGYSFSQHDILPIPIWTVYVANYPFDVATVAVTLGLLRVVRDRSLLRGSGAILLNGAIALALACLCAVALAAAGDLAFNASVTGAVDSRTYVTMEDGVRMPTSRSVIRRTVVERGSVSTAFLRKLTGQEARCNRTVVVQHEGFGGSEARPALTVSRNRATATTDSGRRVEVQAAPPQQLVWGGASMVRERDSRSPGAGSGADGEAGELGDTSGMRLRIPYAFVRPAQGEWKIQTSYTWREALMAATSLLPLLGFLGAVLAAGFAKAATAACRTAAMRMVEPLAESDPNEVPQMFKPGTILGAAVGVGLVVAKVITLLFKCAATS